MRVSTGMIYDAGVASIQRQTASLLHTQQQVASGRRVLTPSDDPVAASRALEVQQAADMNAQYRTNQDNARSALGLVESRLQQVQDIINLASERAVQAGGGALTERERGFIAGELRQRFEELVGIANATDGTGQYLFSGYQGGNAPFAGTIDAGVRYAGDDGERTLQVSSSRQIVVGDSGADIFMRVRNGNGSFFARAAATNTGSGLIDAGNVTNAAAWGTARVSIRFAVDSSANPPLTTYDLVDTVSGDSLLTGTAAAAAGPYPRSFVPGQAIALRSQGAEPAFDLGGAVTLTGAPADGDAFELTPSTNQSLFQTLAELITAIEQPGVGTAASTTRSNEVGVALRELSNGLDSVLAVRAAVGSRLNELDALSSVSEDLSLQYDSTLSRLQDVDYAQAISQLTREQANLEAAQRSFVRVTGLSLFDYL